MTLLLFSRYFAAEPRLRSVLRSNPPDFGAIRPTRRGANDGPGQESRQKVSTSARRVGGQGVYVPFAIDAIGALPSRGIFHGKVQVTFTYGASGFASIGSGWLAQPAVPES